jgi:hypothetical protein
MKSRNYKTPLKTTILTVPFVLCFAHLCWSAKLAKNISEEKATKLKPVLSLTIRCDRKKLKTGDEIPITFVIKNEGTTEYKYDDRSYDRSGRMPEYELSAVDNQGKKVPDPRAKWTGGLMGGLGGGERKIGSSNYFTKTIVLNRWALITKPGTYIVTGTYHPEGNLTKIVSSPIRIKILPRSDTEMSVYINKLILELSSLRNTQEQAAQIRKLMYTFDRRVVPIMIEFMYNRDNTNFWAGEAFNYYLPYDQQTNDALYDAAKKRGLAKGMLQALRYRGFNDEKIKLLINLSLSPEHPYTWVEGALAAQQYPDDRFASRLSAIALDPNSKARLQAIYALAKNRTDESVATLKKLLKESDPNDPKERTIRQNTEHAIRQAYQQGNNTKGRPFRKDDFDIKYQRKD